MNLRNIFCIERNILEFERNTLLKLDIRRKGIPLLTNHDGRALTDEMLRQFTALVGQVAAGIHHQELRRHAQQMVQAESHFGWSNPFFRSDKRRVLVSHVDECLQGQQEKCIQLGDYDQRWWIYQLVTYRNSTSGSILP